MADEFNISDTPEGGGTPVAAGALVTHSINQSIPNATATVLSFDGEDFDTDAYHDTVTNNDRLTIPAGKAGKYLIGMDLEWEASVGGQFRRATFLLNGVTDIGRDSFRDIGSGTPDQNFNVVAIVRDLSVGDFITLEVEHDEGGALDVQATSDFSPKFWLMQLGT